MISKKILYQTHVDILKSSTEPLYHTELNPTGAAQSYINQHRGEMEMELKF
jgi:hypothetical protein